MKTMRRLFGLVLPGWVFPAVLSLAFCDHIETPVANSITPGLVRAQQDTAAGLCYLALGDSYTIGQSVPLKDRFPVQAVAALRKEGYPCKEAEIIAETGWTTEDLLTAIADKTAPPYDFVSLLIGVNDQYGGGSPGEYRKELSSILTKSIQLVGNRPNRVILLSIPDYSVTPFARSLDKAAIAKEINSFNQVNAKLAAFYHVNYVDITRESRKAAHDATLVAYDGLHFSGKEYAVWSALLVPVIRRVIQ